MAQTGRNMIVALRPESVFNTPPGTGSGKRLRIAGEPPGLKLNRAIIRSQEINSDGQTRMFRLGSNMIDGTYPVELSLGSFDDYFEAVTRGTWVAAVAVTQATAGLTSIRTPTTSTIEASAGSFITAGIRAGDSLRLTGFATAANNSINLRVKSVTATIIQLYGTPLTVDAAFDTTFTLTIAKKLSNPAVPVRRTFYVDQYYADLDLSEVFGGCRIASMKLTAGPDAMAMAELGLVGASLAGLAAGSSPYYIAPTVATSIPLVWTDASIAYGGSDILTLSNLDINLDLTARTMPVIGSNTTPDVFDNLLTIGGTISGLRSDLANLTRYQQETELELHATLVEPESEPKDHITFYIPRIKLSSLAPKLGGDNGMIETMAWEAGKKESVSGYDDTMLTISTSAP
jgi:hypothetical protein